MLVSLNWIRYTAVFTIPILTWMSFTGTGVWTYVPILEAFILIPLLEVVIKPDPSNLDKAEKELAARNKIYDFILYLMPVVLFGGLYLYLDGIDAKLTFVDWIGRTLTMGLLIGTIGINVAHELGHRTTEFERFLSKALLTPALYIHFHIEHNKGHHRNVGTYDDPATARKGESVYAFWLRSIWRSYGSAWGIASAESKKKHGSVWTFKNPMIQYALVQVIFCVTIYLAFGLFVFASFLLTAIIGVLLLESIQYIEHYGLVRQKVTERRYENVEPRHSWNSNHVLGRVFLFELTRHSDHHFQPSKKYQLLDNMDDAPQLPTGYPGSILLSLVPPIWFKVVDPIIEKVEAQ